MHHLPEDTRAPCPAPAGSARPRLAALNSRAETFRCISYTTVITHTDEQVKPSDTPATASSSLHTGEGVVTNVATQDL